MNRKEQCNEYVYQYFRTHPCEKCSEAGEQNVSTSLKEFAHKNRSTKLANVSDLRNQGKLEEMIAEIEKCRVLCVLHHRQETAKESKWYHLKRLFEDEQELETFDDLDILEPEV